MKQSESKALEEFDDHINLYGDKFTDILRILDRDKENLLFIYIQMARQFNGYVVVGTLEDKTLLRDVYKVPVLTVNDVLTGEYDRTRPVYILPSTFIYTIQDLQDKFKDMINQIYNPVDRRRTGQGWK